MFHHSKHAPVPTILRPVVGIKFEMSSFCLNIYLCSIVNKILAHVILQFFLIFTLLKFKKTSPTFMECGLYKKMWLSVTRTQQKKTISIMSHAFHSCGWLEQRLRFTKTFIACHSLALYLWLWHCYGEQFGVTISLHNSQGGKRRKRIWGGRTDGHLSGPTVKWQTGGTSKWYEMEDKGQNRLRQKQLDDRQNEWSRRCTLINVK